MVFILATTVTAKPKPKGKASHLEKVRTKVNVVAPIDQLLESVFLLLDIVLTAVIVVVGFGQRVHELLQPLHVISGETLKGFGEESSPIFVHRCQRGGNVRPFHAGDVLQNPRQGVGSSSRSLTAS